MNLSRKGELFIACREAIVLVAYQDGKHMSIGLGDNDPKLKAGHEITVEESFVRFRRAIATRVNDVSRRIKTRLLQHEFDAVFSCYYQSGTDALADLAAAIHSGDKKAVGATFLKHDTNAEGDHMEGLLKRRAREFCLFMTGEYGDLTQIPIFRGHPKKVAREWFDAKDFN
jgi:GH24 family phage-related lysozyme (muramidase)